MREPRGKLQQQIVCWVDNDGYTVEFQRWAELAKADGCERVANQLTKTAENLELITRVLCSLLEALDDPLHSNAVKFLDTETDVQLVARKVDGA